MSLKEVFILTLILSNCFAQNILNLLDFAAPIFGVLNAQTPEVCYDDLGCFRNDGDFRASPQRPISRVPQSPQIIGTEFLFYSRKSPTDPQIIDSLDSHLFKEIDFNPNLNTKFVIHGYKEGLLIHGFSHESFEEVKDGLLYNEDSNVILVRWTRGASGLYFQSVANCRVVAAQIAFLIRYLINERNGRSEMFHLIGFSLGSHISGYVGKLIPNLGRITALDAAKPYFDGVPPTVRLDVSDALFIDSLHTDSDIGTPQRIGHIDVYLNGGDRQPGCDRQTVDRTLNDGLLDGFFERISCDHKRALDYYIDFLLNANTVCIPIAYRCDSWRRFMSGHCWTCGDNGEDCTVIGLNTGQNNTRLNHIRSHKYFIITNDKQPFCVNQYLVKITTHSMTKSIIDGKFSIRFHSLNNTFMDHKSGSMKFRPQTEISFVISNDRPLNDITKIDLNFETQSTLNESERNALYFNAIQLIPLNIIDQKEKLRNSVTYCTSDKHWVVNREGSATTITLQNTLCS